MDDLAFQSATTLLARLKDGSLSSRELTEHYIARIEAYDGEINAVIVHDFDRARSAADAADGALRERRTLGALHGLPMTIKESFGLAGTPTTFGLEPFADNIAKRDAVAVERLKAAGAIVLGKTNVPPGLMDGQSWNPIYGRTANPWDLERTPGGSSGGSAAALAAGFSALELGSDIASSIRNPAHYCGVFGHKPTYGLCASDGHALTWNDNPPDIGVIGPLARSAVDLELALSVIAGPSEPESLAYALALPPPRRDALAQYRVGLLADDEFAEVDADVSNLLDALGTWLDTQGTEVRRASRPRFDSRELHALYMILLRAAGSASAPDEEFAAALPAAEGVTRFDRDMASLNAYGLTLSHRDWLRLDAERRRLGREWAAYFDGHDLLLCPPLSSAAFRHDDRRPQDRSLMVNEREVPFENQLFWAGYAGLSYLPATVAPIGLTPDGLPVGVQIIGPRYRDLDCLHFASLLEREYRQFTPPPRYSAPVSANAPASS
jgi:amidase